MEINLLNRTGIHTKNNHDFNDIDKSFLSRKDEVLGKDFERDHKVDSTISIKKNDRGKIFFVCLFTVLIVGFSIYYKFFINQKIFVESDRLQSLIQYVVNDEELKLLNFELDNYSIDLKFEIDSRTVFPNELKTYASMLINSDKYRTEIIKNGNVQLVSIKYPPFLEVLNSNFNKDADLVQYDAINQINIDKKALNDFLDNDFNLNNPKIPNFKINRVDDSLFSLVFAK
jgi:hypothetical protein